MLLRAFVDPQTLAIERADRAVDEAKVNADYRSGSCWLNQPHLQCQCSQLCGKIRQQIIKTSKPLRLVTVFILLRHNVQLQ